MRLRDCPPMVVNWPPTMIPVPPSAKCVHHRVRVRVPGGCHTGVRVHPADAIAREPAERGEVAACVQYAGAQGQRAHGVVGAGIPGRDRQVGQDVREVRARLRADGRELAGDEPAAAAVGKHGHHRAVDAREPRHNRRRDRVHRNTRAGHRTDEREAPAHVQRVPAHGLRGDLAVRDEEVRAHGLRSRGGARSPSSPARPTAMRTRIRLPAPRCRGRSPCPLPDAGCPFHAR